MKQRRRREAEKQISARFLAAWAARDVDAIIAMHADGPSFWMHAGEERLVGRDAIRSAFGAIFAKNPGFGFDVHRILFGERHWILDWTMRAEFINRDGKSIPVRIELVDVVDIDDHGEVVRKDTFIDGAQAKAQMAKLG